MDVSGVGLSPAGFSAATPEAALDPQRSGQAGAVRENLGQAKQAPLDLLSDERLGRELLSLGLRPDPGKLLAARALVLQQGCIDPALLLDVERSLQAVDTAGLPEAEAAAFLLARRLPANQETMSWVRERLHATDSAGSRMIAIIERFAAAMAARTEQQGTPAKGEAPPGAMSRPGPEAQAKETAPSGTGAASGAATTKASSSATPTMTPTPASSPSSAPTPASTSAAPSAPTPAPAASASPQGEASNVGKEAATPAAKTAPAEAPKPPAPGGATTAPANSAAPQAQPASAPQAMSAAVAAEVADATSPTASPESPGLKAEGGSLAPEAKATAKPEQPVERQLLAKLQALALPEGKAKDVEAALRRLVQAMRPQEADLARGEVVEAKERLSSLAAKTIAKAPHEASARALHDEVRFQQVNSARHEGQTPHEFVIPVWWKDGSGQIRVQERPKGAARRPGEDSAPIRVAISLATPHLGAIRIDLLLAQRQVNCLVAVQDQVAADFLSPRLTELRSAIEEAGIHVNVMGMKPFSTDEGQPGPGDAKGVDYYW